MELGIRVNIDDLMDKVSAIRNDDFNTVEITISGGDFEDDSVLAISAISAIDDTKVEYGEIPYDGGEI